MDLMDLLRTPWRVGALYLYGLIYISTDFWDFKDFWSAEGGQAVLRVREVRREKKTRNAAHTDGIGKETGRFVQFVVEKFGNVGNYLYLCSVFFD